MPYLLKSLIKEIYLKIRKTFLLPFLLSRKTKNPLKEEVKRILFLRHDRIGDMVLSTAALKALKNAYPLAKITVLASNRNHGIIENNPDVDEIIIYKGFCWFIKEIRKRNFDLAIDPFNTYELKQAFLSYISGARYRIGFEEAGREIFFNVKATRLYPVKHLVEHLLELISFLDVDVRECEPGVFLTDEEIEWASGFLINKGMDKNRLIIAIHPGGYYETQRWHAERFGVVAKRIVEEMNGDVIIFGNQGEERILDTIRKICGDDVVVISGMPLRQFMAVLSKCDLFLGNNTGPLHIASALGLPTVSMTGPTVIPLWLPYGKNHIVLKKDLDCSPCNKGRCKDHRCMEMIQVEEVVEAVRKQTINLKRKGPFKQGDASRPLSNDIFYG